VSIEPGADFCYCLLRGSNISLGPGRITSNGRDRKLPVRLGRLHTDDIGTLTHTEGRPANLRKVHQRFLVDRINRIIEGGTVLVECVSDLKCEGGSTELLVRPIFASSRGGVSGIAPVVVPVLDLITNSGDCISVWR
jgi:hypothetical protein